MGIQSRTNQTIPSTNIHRENMKNLAIALFSTLLAFSNASFWEAGPCPPKPEVVTPFEPEAYLGDWYSVYETPMPYTTRENTYNRYQYGPLPQGVNNVSVYITTTYPDSEELGEAPCAWMQPVAPVPICEISEMEGMHNNP